MSIFENILNALSTIWSNKLRSSLTMLGIIIGVSSVVIMIAIGQGTQSSITASLESMGTNLLMVMPGGSMDMRAMMRGGGSGTLLMADYEFLENIEGLTGISPQVSANTQVVYGTTNTSATVYGVLPNYFELKNKELLSGSNLDETYENERKRVVLIDESMSEELFGAADPVSEKVYLDGTIFTIIGTIEGDDDAFYSPLSTVQLRLIGDKSLSMINVFVEEADDMDRVESEIETILLAKHDITSVEDADFSIANQADMLETMSEITQTLTLMLGGIAAISLIVGGIGVMNIMLVSVTERTREIGIRKAIGAHPNDILLQFLTESAILSLLGGIIGILISFTVTYLLTTYLSVATTISVPSVFLAFFFSALVGIVFGLLPARKAAKTQTIDALRFE